jgi:PAN domain
VVAPPTAPTSLRPQVSVTPSEAGDVIRETFFGLASDCASLCRQESGCASYRFDPNSKKCQMLRGVSGSPPVSAPPLSIAALPNNPAPYKPYNSPTQSSVPSQAGDVIRETFFGLASDCASLCRQESGCASYRFDPNSKKCQLLRGLGGISPTSSAGPSSNSPSSNSAPTLAGPRVRQTFVGAEIDCSSICRSSAGCRRYSFDASSKSCSYESLR